VNGEVSLDIIGRLTECQYKSDTISPYCTFSAAAITTKMRDIHAVFGTNLHPCAKLQPKFCLAISEKMHPTEKQTNNELFFLHYHGEIINTVMHVPRTSHVVYSVPSTAFRSERTGRCAGEFIVISTESDASTSEYNVSITVSPRVSRLRVTV